MIRVARRSLAVVALLAAGARALAQTPNDGTAELYAERRNGAFARLNTNLLIVLSRWSPAQVNQPAFLQDPTFYYFPGADHLPGALLVLDGKTRRAAVSTDCIAQVSWASGDSSAEGSGRISLRGSRRRGRRLGRVRAVHRAEAGRRLRADAPRSTTTSPT